MCPESTAGHRASVLVKVDDLDLGMWALRDAHFSTERVNGELRVDVPPERAGDVTRVLAAAGQWVTELRPDRFSLEDVFLELTSSHSDLADTELADTNLAGIELAGTERTGVVA